MMRNILVLGAGKSATVLIDYLAQHATAGQWTVTVADADEQQALAKTKNRPHTAAVGLDAGQPAQRFELIASHQVVISMLPAFMHPEIAVDCVRAGTHLITPSYVSEAMQALHTEAQQKGIVLLNEMGLDPGIDHMSAMQLLDKLRSEGNTITSFKSHCGGLIAPESDTNPWHYKFSWNPRNVVLAGQGKGGIHFLQNGEEVNLTYHELFASASDLYVAGFGHFESYANRDSLKYRSVYHLTDAHTLYRGTLRVPPFCRGWQVLIDCGLTQDAELQTETFVRNCLHHLDAIQDASVKPLLDYLDIQHALQSVTDSALNPSRLLQHILEQKWALQPGDKDMIVMVHEIGYKSERGEGSIQSSLLLTGKDEQHTAMAATVGLPIAFATEMLLNGRLKRTGVVLPVTPDLYNPILEKLQNHGILFSETIS